MNLIPKLSRDHEVRVKVSVSNNRLRMAREELNLTQTKLAKIIGVHVGIVNGLECLRLKPCNYKKGQITNWSDTAIKISNFFGMELAYLFPDDLYKIKNNFIEVSGSVEKLPHFLFQFSDSYKQLEAPDAQYDKKELCSLVSTMLNELTPTYKKIIEMRIFENKTLDETAKTLNMLRPRVRAIEMFILRKFRSQKYVEVLKDYVED